MKEGIDGEFVKHGQEFFNKPVTKTFVAAVVPRSDLDDLIFPLQVW